MSKITRLKIRYGNNTVRAIQNKNGLTESEIKDLIYDTEITSILVTEQMTPYEFEKSRR